MARTTASHDRTAADLAVVPISETCLPGEGRGVGQSPTGVDPGPVGARSHTRAMSQSIGPLPGWVVPAEQQVRDCRCNAHQVATVAAEDSALEAFAALDWVLRPAVRAAPGKGALSSAELGVRTGRVVGSAVGGCGAAEADGTGLRNDSGRCRIRGIRSSAAASGKDCRGGWGCGRSHRSGFRTATIPDQSYRLARPRPHARHHRRLPAFWRRVERHGYQCCAGCGPIHEPG